MNNPPGAGFFVFQPHIGSPKTFKLKVSNLRLELHELRRCHKQHKMKSPTRPMAGFFMSDHFM